MGKLAEKINITLLSAHEHISFMECALSQNVLLPLLIVHFVTKNVLLLILILLLFKMLAIVVFII